MNCSDPDGNWNWSTEWFFTRDLTPPNITLNTPQNDSGIYFGLGSVTFEWVATDSADTVLRCNLTIDGINNKTNFLVDIALLNLVTNAAFKVVSIFLSF